MLGLAQSKEGNPSEAVVSFTKFTELEPLDDDGFYALGLVLKKTGQLPKAHAAFVRATELNDQSPEVYFDLGLLHLALDETLAAGQ